MQKESRFDSPIRILLFLFCSGILSFAGSHAGALESVFFDPAEYQLGDMSEGRVHDFNVVLKNTSGRTLNILSVDPTCVYVEASADKTSVGSGETVRITVRVDARNNIGKITKVIEIRTDAFPEPHMLTIRGTITHPVYDRDHLEAIFQPDCKKCHMSTQVQSLRGEQLYDAVCYACHKGARNLKTTSGDQAATTIEKGLHRKMPAFIDASKGPLSRAQIDSLIEFIMRKP